MKDWTSVRYALLAFLILAKSSAALAQTSGVEPGDQVRFRTDTSASFHFATVARLTADSLALETCEKCERLNYARTEINHLDVYRVEHPGDRALSGLLLGALFGGALGFISAKTCHGTADKCELAALAIPAGALFGGLLGGIVGFFSGYRWQPVPAAGT